MSSAHSFTSITRTKDRSPVSSDHHGSRSVGEMRKHSLRRSFPGTSLDVLRDGPTAEGELFGAGNRSTGTELEERRSRNDELISSFLREGEDLVVISYLFFSSKS